MKKRLLKRGLAAVLCVTCLMGAGTNVLAEKEKKAEQEEDEQKKIKKAALEKMSKDQPTGRCMTMDELNYQMEAQKKIVPESNRRKDWPKGPLIQADSACLMDYDSGCILYAKQAEKKQYPASITKICTALLAIENGAMEDEIVFSEEAIYSVPPDYAHIALQPGEKLSLEDALYGMMLASANEVAYGIGENIGQKAGGDYNTFLQMMNDKAKSLGCVNTHFANTNGVFMENHYVSALGMAKICREAWRYPEFRTVSKSEEHTIDETNLVDEKRIVHPFHKMYPKNSKFHYKPAVAGKTGFVFESLNTLVTYAEKDGRTLIAVVLRGNGPETYTDTENLFEYGFNEFKNTETLQKTIVTLPKDRKLSDLKETEMEKSGGKDQIAYTLDGTRVGVGKKRIIPRVRVTPKEKTASKKSKAVSPKEKKITLLIKGLLTVAVVLEIVLITLRSKRKKKSRKKRRSRKR